MWKVLLNLKNTNIPSNCIYDEKLSFRKKKSNNNNGTNGSILNEFLKKSTQCQKPKSDTPQKSAQFR